MSNTESSGHLPDLPDNGENLTGLPDSGAAAAAGAAALGHEGSSSTSFDPETERAAQTLSAMRGFLKDASPVAISQGVKPFREGVRTLGEGIDSWMGAADQTTAAIGEDAKDRFVKIWFAFAKRSEHGVDPSDMNTARSLWRQYWADTRRLHEEGFRRPHLLASYNSGQQLCDYAEQSGKPGTFKAVANARVSDPIGLYIQRLETEARLRRVFSDHPFATERLISKVMDGGRPDAVDEMQDRLAGIEELATTYAGVEGFDGVVQAFVAQNPQSDPTAVVEAYLERRRSIEDMLTAGSDDLVDRSADAGYPPIAAERIDWIKDQIEHSAYRSEILRELALSSDRRASSRRADPLLEALLLYGERLAELHRLDSLRRFETSGPEEDVSYTDAIVHADTDLLEYAAAARVRGRANIHERHKLARDLQLLRDGGRPLGISPDPLPPSSHAAESPADSPAKSPAAEDSPSSHQAETTESTGRNIDPASTLEHLTSTLGGIALEHIPSTVGGIDERIEAIRERIASIQSNITESNRRESEARISTLQQAVSNLEGAANVLSQGNNSVADSIGGYVEEVGGSE